MTQRRTTTFVRRVGPKTHNASKGNKNNKGNKGNQRHQPRPAHVKKVSL